MSVQADRSGEGHSRQVVQVLTARQFAAQVVDAAVQAYNATGGAVFIERNGHTELIHATDGWQGEAALALPLQSDSAQMGRLVVGARRDGGAYSANDQEALRQAADVVAGALGLSLEVPHLSSQHTISVGQPAHQATEHKA